MLFAIVAAFDVELDQMGVHTTFLHGDIDKELYMKQLEGFVIPGKEHLVCKLNRSLYGSTKLERFEETLVSMMVFMIRSNALEPYNIIQAQMGEAPIVVKALFQSVACIQWIWSNQMKGTQAWHLCHKTS